MQAIDFVQIVTWVGSHNYPIILVGMFLEGPIITTAAGFIAGLGYLNIFILWGLSIVGDFFGDTLYYYLGYFERHHLLKHGPRFGLSSTRLDKLQQLFLVHPWKALAIIKTGPMFTGGLLLAGAMHMPYSSYIFMALTITASKNIPLLLIGYLAGQAHNYTSSYLSYGAYYIFGGVILLLILTQLAKALTSRITKSF